MNVIDIEKDFYEGIKDTIVSGLDYGWFNEHVAQRIARCYGLTRKSILKYDAEELGSFDERTPDEIDNVFGEETEYPEERD
tara:strand:- start:1056 stop:1298 length:243 start_codon:yes stop_codon:yes gene_type:complete